MWDGFFNKMSIKIFSSGLNIEEDISWMASMNEFSEKYIREAFEFNKKNIINNRDFGLSHHSTALTNDPCFYKFSEFILKKSFLFLENQGYCLKNYSLALNDLWVQEFSKQRKIQCGDTESKLLVEFFIKKYPHLKFVI